MLLATTDVTLYKCANVAVLPFREVKQRNIDTNVWTVGKWRLSKKREAVGEKISDDRVGRSFGGGRYARAFLVSLDVDVGVLAVVLDGTSWRLPHNAEDVPARG